VRVKKTRRHQSNCPHKYEYKHYSPPLVHKASNFVVQQFVQRDGNAGDDEQAGADGDEDHELNWEHRRL